MPDTLGLIAIAAWVLLAWYPALLIAREYVDLDYGEGTVGLMFVGTWLMAPLMLPLFAAGWLTIKVGRMIVARERGTDA